MDTSEAVSKAELPWVTNHRLKHWALGASSCPLCLFLVLCPSVKSDHVIP